MRAVLVVAEVALSVVLLDGASLSWCCKSRDE
jgi:hypothetical protein